MKKSPALRAKLIRLQENWCLFCYRQMDPVEADSLASAQLFRLDDKFAPWKGKFAGHLRAVAACRECVREISDKRQANIPIEELHRRSGCTNGGETVYALTPQH